MKLIKILFFSFLFTIAGQALAQTVSGNTQVGVSTFQTYTYSGSYSTGYRWAVVGGTISSSSGLTVNIIWSGSPGTGKVQFYPSRFAFTPHELSVTKHANPPTPSTPSVSGNSCGNKTVTRGNPPSGITWYWQTSSSGVSTSNASSTYTKTSSGYVYLRARRNSTGQWSGSASVYVTVNHAPPTPSALSVSSNSCGNKTVTRGNPPSGVTWYWQTSSGGTSTSNSSSTYTVTSSRTVYLRARNNSSGCWSGVQSIFVSVNQSPAQPSSLSVSSNVCGSKTVTRPGAPGGQTYYWQTSASGTSTGNSNGTYSVSGSQWVYLRARNDIGGCWSTARSVYVTVNPLPPTPATPSVSGNTCGNKTVTRGNPPSGVTWYWQTSSGGTNTSNSSSTYTKTSSGNVYLRARNNATGCWSTNSSAVNVTVNHAPTAPTISGLSRCGTGNALLVVDGYSQNQFAPFKWYTGPSGGTAFASGISSINENVSSTTSFYVSRYDETTLCESARTQVVVTVQQPVHTTGSAESHCQTEVAVPLTGEPAHTGSWSINGPSSAIVFGNAVDMTVLTPGQTYQVTYTYANGVCASNTFTKNMYVRPLSVAGIISSDTIRCGSGASSFTLSGHTGTVLKWESRYKDGSGDWGGWSTITDTDDVLQVSPTLDQWADGVRTYEIKASIQNGECSVIDATQQITIDPESVGGTVSGGKEAFASASGSLILNNNTGAVQRWEKSTDGGATWSTINHTSANYPYNNVLVTTLFRAVVKSGTCAEIESSSELVSILPAPVISMSGLPNIRDCESTKLIAPQGYASYTWYLDNVVLSGETSHELNINRPGTYKVTITSSGGASYTVSNFVVTSQYMMDQNAVTTFTFRIPTTDPDSTFCFSIAERSVDTQIFDGLGRPLQQVSLNASPLAKDIVVPAEYDDLGRQLKTYLPYPDSSVSTIYKPNALVYQPAYYLSNKDSDKAFSEIRYETSPLNRPVEQGAPGDDWQIGLKTVDLEYDIADADEVINWDIEDLPTKSTMPYESGALYENSTVDEDDNKTVEYTNKQGHTILKKSQVNDSTWAETYYIYDKYGQLVVVIPPEATFRLDAEFFGQSVETRKAFLNTWAFLYNYDDRNRMTMKKVPGADSVFMVYDRWDRLVLTQDGNQRLDSTWLFTKYDALDRPVMTGLATIGGSTTSVRDLVAASTERAESFDVAGVNEYTDVTYPSHSAVDEYLTVTYYDNYNWDNSGLTYTNPTGLPQNTAVKGQVTGTLTRTGTGEWIKSASYYDDKYRVIQTQSTNHLGGTDIVTNYYDFIGQVTRNISSHNNGVNTTVITRTFEYDHAGRLLKTWHALNNEDSVLIAQNNYNELGELEEKNLHGGEQSLDYTYNIRGWLTSMNKADLSGDDGDLFGMELLYDQPDGTLPNTRMYNGNISAMKWSNYDVTGSSTNQRAYMFGYDRLNRLDSAKHFENNTPTNRYGVPELNYDLNGNITNLIRNNSAGSAMDDLSYGYEGNRLQYVADTSGDSLGFYNGYTADSLQSPDYAYDENGNMIQDLNKGITDIAYNHLNLPTKAVFETAGDSITYLYDAAGIKLQQVVYREGDTVKVTDYVGEFIYENDTLQLIQHEEGRIVYMDYEQKWDYQYHLKDHLGNVRLTFSTEPNVYDRIATMEDTGETASFDHWVQSQRNGPSNVGNTSSHVMRLNTDSQGDSTLIEGVIGLSSMYLVQKGDQLDLSVKAYYEQPPQQNGFFASNLLLNMIINGSTGSSSAGTENGTDIANSNLDETIVGNIQQDKTDDLDANAPRAYMNWMIFDQDTILITSGFKQISSGAQFSWETLATDVPIAIEEDGFFFAYVSNETNGLSVVDFDDFHISLTKTNVVSSQDYYPFGLTFNERVRVASTEQRFKYNGKELEVETNWHDYGARRYMADIGGWTGVDALADAYIHSSPYVYVLNNPLKFVDPDGKKVLYVNGYWRDDWIGKNVMGSSRSGIMYWGRRFVREASKFFNDGQRGNGMWIDGSSQWGGDDSGSDRYGRGYEYAKEHYDELIADMRQDETFKIVTHSEGGAFGAGIAQYLIDQGKTVETILHLSTDEADEFDSPKNVTTYQLGYGGDWITGNKEVNGADIFGVVDKFSSKKDKFLYSHGSTKSGSVFDEVKAMIKAAASGSTGINVTETDSGVKFEFIRTNDDEDDDNE